MKHSMFSVYVGRTASVLADLKFLCLEEIEIANEAIREIAKLTARDAKNDKLKGSYVVTLNDIAVVALARQNGRTIYVTVVHVGYKGDWDPDGCEGFDHLAFSKIHEMAIAFVTFKDGRPDLFWLKEDLLQLGSWELNIATHDIWPQEIRNLIYWGNSINDGNNNLPPNAIESGLGFQKYSYSRPSRRHCRHCGLDLSTLQKLIVRQLLEHLYSSSQPIQLRRPSRLTDDRTEVPKVAYRVSSRRARIALSLPPKLKSLLRGQDYSSKNYSSLRGLDQRKPPTT